MFVPLVQTVLQGSTLVVASASVCSTCFSSLISDLDVQVGFCGQLATELLVQSTPATKIGIIHSKHIMPFSASGTSAAEIFFSEQMRVTFCLIRSPFRVESAAQFAEDFVHFIREQQFSRVIVLSSSDAMKKDDVSLQSMNPFASFSSQQSTQQLEAAAQNSGFRDLGLVGPDDMAEISMRDHAAPAGAEDEDASPHHRSQRPTNLQRVDGGEFARHLHRCCKRDHIPMIALIRYVAEGFDNRQDARELAARALTVIDERAASGWTWTEPAAWSQVFGDDDPDASMFA